MTLRAVIVFCSVLALLCFSCQEKRPPAHDVAQPDERSKARTDSVTAPPVEEIPPWTESSYSAPGRIVAVGDVHGDYGALLETLQLAALVDADGRWIGSNATLVQTGDLLDRGDDEQKIIDYLERLQTEARAAGGAVLQLNGNHEVMNVAGDLRYVTVGGFEDFEEEDVDPEDLAAEDTQRIPVAAARPRYAAFRPGGRYARLLADHPIVAIVDDTVFAHGGVLPAHVHYGIDALNREMQMWFEGERDAPAILSGDDAPVWTRAYSHGDPDCSTLAETLELLGAKRMVVGHTVQRGGITSACGERVWRIDVGMSRHYGGKPGALEIDAGVVRPLTSP